MRLLKIVFCVLLLSLVGCAEMGLKPHKPSMKSTLEINKTAGEFRILSIEGATPEMAKLLLGEKMSCGTTTFQMPRGNIVESFIREIYQEELKAAQKHSPTGQSIAVIVNKMELRTDKPGSGEWSLDVDYTLDGKTTNVKNTIEFESKVSVLTSCVNIASVFEEAVADSLVEYFKKIR